VPVSYAAAVLAVEPQDAVHVSYAPLRDRQGGIEHRGAEAEVLFVRPEDRALVIRYR
jgi:hypothetical protein